MPDQDPSEHLEGPYSPAIPTDRGICRECARELADPGSRHYRYAGIHCNQCGPLDSLLEDLPLKRSNTSLKEYPPCQECQAEQRNPGSRRYRMETIICPVCGPQVWLEIGDTGVQKKEARGDQAVLKAQRILAQGKLLSMLGSTGLYLVCDAANPQAVERLRQKLDSPDRPLPLIAANLQSADELCLLDKPAADTLESSMRPVLILEKRAETQLTKHAAPFLRTIGIRLPASGLEQLLFLEGKRSRLPVGGTVRPPNTLLAAHTAYIKGTASLRGQEAVAALSRQGDGMLLQDFSFQVQGGETVLRLFSEANPAMNPPPAGGGTGVFPIRIGRGSTPLPVELPFPVRALLAGGSDRHNTICFARSSRATLSRQNGNLKHSDNLAYFDESASQLERLTGIQPEILVHDLDRQSLATRYVLERAGREALPAVPVQHHHAHIAACMAENGLADGQPVAGIAFDFGGVGEDPEQARPVYWGGEFLVAGYTDYMRAYHLSYLPLPGGETAAGNLARTALAYLWEAGIPWEIDIPSVSAVCAQENSLLRSMLKHRLNTPLQSSMGRLFEAVASLVGLRQEVSYPSQALLEMESAVDPEEKTAYNFELRGAADGRYEIDPLPVIRAVVEDVHCRVRIGQVSARLHNGVAELAYQVCTELRNSHNTHQVALSGEIWQNAMLLEKTVRMLRQGGFQVYTHHLTPFNDACLSLGQAVIAGKRLA